MVANRLPVRRLRRGGHDEWAASPGGLVAALLPILRRESEAGRSGAWVGWTGERVRSFEPFESEGVLQVPVNLSGTQVSEFYDGMSNTTLWPLYHDVVRPPEFKRRWWRTYEAVNETFADAVASIASPGAQVWVHDYHLHLVPRMLRERRADLRIGYFLHIPFPCARLFAQLPWRSALVEGTTGADVVGLQTEEDAQNFMDASCRHAGFVRVAEGVQRDGRTVRVSALPISIDACAIDEVSRRPDVRARAAGHRRRLGGRRIFLGVDRMDYTKGIPHRLRAFRELLRTGRARPDEVVLVQSCVPTRERVDAYAALNSEVEELIGQINGEFGEVGRGCVHYLRRNLPIEQLVALYLAADVAMVTPVRDGMNLIAKEYVAARHDEGGVLMLSEYAGAASELPESVIVNPHDLDGTTAAAERCLRMDPAEARERMRAMRGRVFSSDVFRWADRFLSSLRAVRGPAPLSCAGVVLPPLERRTNAGAAGSAVGNVSG